MGISTDTEIHKSPRSGTCAQRSPEKQAVDCRGLPSRETPTCTPWHRQPHVCGHRGPQTNACSPARPFGSGELTVLPSHTLSQRDPREAYTSGQQARPWDLSSLR